MALKPQKMEVDTEDVEIDNFKSRPYQDELLEYAIKQNTIIYLPTGSGKTFIALMAIRHFAKDLQISLDAGGKRSVFLVNTVVLANQQTSYIQQILNMKTSVYTGEMNVDNWKRAKWRDEFENNHIIVATCQIILDVIRHGFIKLENINIIVFDECHHGNKKHPMHQLMQQFENVPLKNQPRVIGLTGMLLTGQVTPDSVKSDMEKLENTFQSVIRTVNTFEQYINVLSYSTNPTEIILPYYYAPPDSKITSKVKMLVERYILLIDQWPIDIDNSNVLVSTSFKYYDKAPNPIKKLVNAFKDFLHQMEELGIYGGLISILSVLIDFELQKREAKTTSHKNLIRVLITGVELIAHVLHEEMIDIQTSYQKILTYGSSKVKRLFVYLEEYLQNHNADELKGLIFVNRRHTAKCLYHILKLYAKENPLFQIRPDFMVGRNNNIPESIETILEDKWNRRVIEKFKKNETNLIVATSVLEEGVDLQMCNLVMTFDFPITFRSYIQSKGRARMINSTFAIMLREDERSKCVRKITEYKAIDEKLKEYLVGKTIERKAPLKSDIENELFVHDIPPFFTTKAKLEVLSAMSLLNRYCNMLPRDFFSSPTVTWTQVDVDRSLGTFYVKIDLPSQSIYKEEISGIVTNSLKLAKRSAAFNACIKLYKCGELNENLLPVSSKVKVEELKPVYFKLWGKYPEDEVKIRNKLVGTTKISRPYDLKYPDEINQCQPNVDKVSYLYIISIESVKTEGYSDPNDDGAQIYKDLLLDQQNYGILTSKRLPNLPSFKTFLSIGEIAIKILPEPIQLYLKSENDVEYIKKFHIMLFKDLLRVWKRFFVYNNTNDCQSYMIVPTKNNAIDWDLILKFQKLKKSRELSVVERSNMEFKREAYEHMVLTPWYRADTELRYIVTRVLEYKTPESEFPNSEFTDFADYYKQKYQQTIQTIVNKNQFLIEVKGVTTKLNRLYPLEEGNKNKKIFSETLIPELCFNFGFPGNMWLKAILIPSVLHRLQYMLNAEKLRITINNVLNMKDDLYEPEMLDIDKNMHVDLESHENKNNINSSNVGILKPNPNDVVATKLTTNDCMSLYDIFDTPWKEKYEPIDLSRNLEVIHQCELDYYFSFINNECFGQKVVDDDDIPMVDAYSKYKNRNPNRLAITDATYDEKCYIEILDESQHKALQLRNLIKAITTSTSNDVFDMEKYEVLGDSYLKFTVSMFLFQKYPHWHEGYLTKTKGQIVSNRHLLYCGIEREIPTIMKIWQFTPKNDWIPPLVTVPKIVTTNMVELQIPCNYLHKLEFSNDEMESGNVSDKTFENFLVQIYNENDMRDDPSSMNIFLGKQYIRDKAVSDCVEAILGVVVQSFGVENSLKMLQYFHILPNEENLAILFKSESKNPIVKDKTQQSDIDGYLINYLELEKTLGYTFKNRAYLLQALTHASYVSNRLTESYQKLEFLGDAVLDFLITAYICQHCQNLDPGKLTDLRSALVNNTTLACITVRHKLHLFMLYQNALLSETIMKFNSFQVKQNHKVNDQVELLVQEDDLNIADFIDVPKALGDVFEAIIGAIYLDCNKCLKTTWKSLYKLMKNEIEEFMANVPIQIVRRLLEYPKANPKFSDAVIIENGNTMINVSFTKLNTIYEATGFGKNKEDAKKAAAKLALQMLAK